MPEELAPHHSKGRTGKPFFVLAAMLGAIFFTTASPSDLTRRQVFLGVRLHC